MRQDLGGRYDIEFVVVGGRFKSAQGDWSPITYTVVQGLVYTRGIRLRPHTRPSQLYTFSFTKSCIGVWPDIAATLLSGSRKAGP